MMSSINYEITSIVRDSEKSHELRTYTVSRPNGCSLYMANLFAQGNSFLQINAASRSFSHRRPRLLSFVEETTELTGIQKKETDKLKTLFGQVPDFYYVPHLNEQIDFNGKDTLLNVSEMRNHDSIMDLGDTYTIVFGLKLPSCPTTQDM